MAPARLVAREGAMDPSSASPSGPRSSQRSPVSRTLGSEVRPATADPSSSAIAALRASVLSYSIYFHLLLFSFNKRYCSYLYLYVNQGICMCRENI